MGHNADKKFNDLMYLAFWRLIRRIFLIVVGIFGLLYYFFS